jgi:hypothetical protein
MRCLPTICRSELCVTPSLEGVPEDNRVLASVSGQRLKGGRAKKRGENAFGAIVAALRPSLPRPERSRYERLAEAAQRPDGGAAF